MLTLVGPLSLISQRPHHQCQPWLPSSSYFCASSSFPACRFLFCQLIPSFARGCWDPSSGLFTRTWHHVDSGNFKATSITFMLVSILPYLNSSSFFDSKKFYSQKYNQNVLNTDQGSHGQQNIFLAALAALYLTLVSE